jgi:hypothetical protein
MRAPKAPPARPAPKAPPARPAPKAPPARSAPKAPPARPAQIQAERTPRLPRDSEQDGRAYPAALHHACRRSPTNSGFGAGQRASGIFLENMSHLVHWWTTRYSSDHGGKRRRKTMFHQPHDEESPGIKVCAGLCWSVLVCAGLCWSAVRAGLCWPVRCPTDLGHAGRCSAVHRGQVVHFQGLAAGTGLAIVCDRARYRAL